MSSLDQRRGSGYQNSVLNLINEKCMCLKIKKLVLGWLLTVHNVIALNSTEGKALHSLISIEETHTCDLAQEEDQLITARF